MNATKWMRKTLRLGLRGFKTGQVDGYVAKTLTNGWVLVYTQSLSFGVQITSKNLVLSFAHWYVRIPRG